MHDVATSLTGDAVRAIRTALGLSASEAAALVGLSDGAAWRRWERNGISGPAAILLGALMVSPALRDLLGVRLDKTLG